ncbi:MAG: DMT family transporter [Acutalibacteraceae bacterium]|nr:DMT family transporter [Acutalibacteraceae bacterium]
MSKQKSIFSKTPVLILVALLCTALWGGAFPGIKFGYGVLHVESADTFLQILFAGYRFTLAGILAWVIGCISNRRVLVPHRGSWHKVLILSLAQTAVQYFFFYIGLAHTTGVRSSIIEGSAAFISLLLAALCFHQEKLTFRKVAGVIIGFGGVVLIETGGGAGLGTFSLFGDGMIFLATICSSLSTVFLRRFTQDEEPFTMSSWQFFLGGLMLTVVGQIGVHAAGPRTELFCIARENGELGKAVLILLLLAGISAIAYSLWGVLLKHNPVSRVTVFNCMIPVFGTLLSMWILQESASQPLWVILTSLLLVVSGTLLVQKS